MYFVKVSSYKNGKKHYVGRGKLFAKYYNYRKQLKLTGLITKRNADSTSQKNDLLTSSGDKGIFVCLCQLTTKFIE